MQTTIAGKLYSLGHPLPLALISLQQTIALTYCIPTKWGDFNPHEYAAQFLGFIQQALYSNTPRSFELSIQEIAAAMEQQIPFISDRDVVLNIKSSEMNKDFLLLSASAAQFRAQCTAAHAQISIESKDLSQNTLYILERIIEHLNTFILWLNRFVSMYSTNKDGNFDAMSILTPWTYEKIKELNL